MIERDRVHHRNAAVVGSPAAKAWLAASKRLEDATPSGVDSFNLKFKVEDLELRAKLEELLKAEREAFEAFKAEGRPPAELWQEDRGGLFRND